MWRAWSKLTKPKMTIMELPYQIHHGLSCIMDPAGGKDWKHLVSSIPNYTAKDVQRIEIEGSKLGASCTMQLLRDMENRGYDVQDLENIIKMSGNENALKCLRNGLESKSTMIKGKYSMSAYHDHECTERSPACEGYHERAENLAGTREILMDRPVQHPRDEVVLHNPLPGTRETLMDNPVQHPRDEVVLHNPLPGTRETLMKKAIELQSPSKIGIQNPGPGTQASMNKVIQRGLKIAQQNTGPRTRRTLTVDSPTQQQSRTTRLHVPVQETKGKTLVLHDTSIESLATENDETLYQLGVSGQRREIKRMVATTNEKKAFYEGDFSLTALPSSFFSWLISCGSQTDARACMH